MPELERLSHLVIEFFEKINSWEHAVVQGTGLSPAQMHTIEIVGHDGPLRMKSLAAKLSVTTGSLTVMVDRLEKKGLLARKPHESDRRSFLVELTEKGKRLFVKHEQYHRRLTEEMLAALTPEEQERFSAILEKIVARM